MLKKIAYMFTELTFDVKSPSCLITVTDKSLIKWQTVYKVIYLKNTLELKTKDSPAKQKRSKKCLKTKNLYSSTDQAINQASK